MPLKLIMTIRRQRESLSFQLAFHNEFRFYDGKRVKTNWRAGSAMVLIAKVKMLITDSKFLQKQRKIMKA